MKGCAKSGLPASDRLSLRSCCRYPVPTQSVLVGDRIDSAFFSRISERPPAVFRIASAAVSIQFLASKSSQSRGAFS